MDANSQRSPEQAAVVAWMTRVLDAKGWTAERWAREAAISPSTVTRAMKEDYPSTSSLPILHKLARAAGVVSPVDFLIGTASLPDAEAVENFLAGLFASHPDPLTPAQIVAALQRRFILGES